MTENIAGISDEAVVDATGEPWGHWLAVLDDHDGTDVDHKRRVAILESAGVESGWWQQQLAVGYERERGLREVGETAEAGYQVGVQRTLPVAREALWELLTDGPGLAAWVGDVDGFDAEPGTTYETADGIAGEVRTVSDGERLRLTWQPAGRAEPTTLQVTLTCTRNETEKTVLRFHHEKLADGNEREAMRNRWKAAADAIAGLWLKRPTTDRGGFCGLESAGRRSPSIHPRKTSTKSLPVEPTSRYSSE